MRRTSIISLFLAVLLLALLSVQSCSVKERRSDCPCFFVLKVPNTEEDMRVYFYDARTMEKLLVRTFTKDELISGSVVLSLPAVDLLVTGVSAESAISNDNVIRTDPFTGYFPPLMGFRKDVPAVPGGEDCFVEALSCHQCCRITITVDASGVVGEAADRITVLSGWDGVKIPLLEPSKGENVCEATKVRVNEFYVDVPRQGDSNIETQFYLGGRPMNTLVLGRLLEDNGYDWTEEDLRPVSVHVHFDSMTATVEVEPWEDTDRPAVMLD